MILYSRPQLIVLLLVVVTAGLGLGVSHWRRAYPELSERLERFDRAPSLPDVTSAEPRPAGSTSRGESGSASSSRPEPAVPAHRQPIKSTPPAHPVDVNRANADELRALPGVGPVLAARIVEARERDGPFASLEDLRRVRGLGRAKLERLANAIALSP